MSGRHLKSILALSMTALILVALAGCSLLGWTSSTPGSIVGTWQFKSGADSFDMTLNSDQTFTQSGLVEGEVFNSLGAYTSNASSIFFPTVTWDYSLSPNGNSMVLNRSGTQLVLILERI